MQFINCPSGLSSSSSALILSSVLSFLLSFLPHSSLLTFSPLHPPIPVLLQQITCFAWWWLRDQMPFIKAKHIMLVNDQQWSENIGNLNTITKCMCQIWRPHTHFTFSQNSYKLLTKYSKTKFTHLLPLVELLCICAPGAEESGLSLGINKEWSDFAPESRGFARTLFGKHMANDSRLLLFKFFGWVCNCGAQFYSPAQLFSTITGKRGRNFSLGVLQDT